MSFQSDFSNSPCHAIETWIGLVHVVPGESNDALEGGVGAYVNAVALASSEADFVQKVTAALAEEQFDTIETMDVETLSAREARASKRKIQLGSELMEAISVLTHTEPVQFGIFEVYMAAD